MALPLLTTTYLLPYQPTNHSGITTFNLTFLIYQNNLTTTPTRKHSSPFHNGIKVNPPPPTPSPPPPLFPPPIFSHLFKTLTTPKKSHIADSALPPSINATPVPRSLKTTPATEELGPLSTVAAAEIVGAGPGAGTGMEMEVQLHIPPREGTDTDTGILALEE